MNLFGRCAVVYLVASLGAASAQAASFVDLDVESIQIQPPQVDTQSEIVVVPRLRNLGSEVAGKFFVTVKIKKNRKTITIIPDIPVMHQLPRGGSGLAVPVEIGYLPEGDYDIEVVVDSGDRIKERNEKNNKLKKSLHVWSPAYNRVTYGG